MLKTGQLCYLHLKSFREREGNSRIFFGSPKPIPAASSCLLKSLATSIPWNGFPGLLLRQERAQERSNKRKT